MVSSTWRCLNGQRHMMSHSYGLINVAHFHRHLHVIYSMFSRTHIHSMRHSEPWITLAWRKKQMAETKTKKKHSQSCFGNDFIYFFLSFARSHIAFVHDLILSRISTSFVRTYSEPRHTGAMANGAEIIFVACKLYDNHWNQCNKCNHLRTKCPASVVPRQYRDV